MPGIGQTDEDVEMTVPQPIYEFVLAPKLSECSQQALVRFVRDQGLYDENTRQRCRTTGEVVETVVCSLTTSLEPHELDRLAHYYVKKNPCSVTDEGIKSLIERSSYAS